MNTRSPLAERPVDEMVDALAEAFSAAFPAEISAAYPVSTVDDSDGVDDEVSTAAIDETGIGSMSDDRLVALMIAAERHGRLVDGLRVVLAGEIGERSRKELGADGLAAAHGCRGAKEFLVLAAGVSGATAHSRLQLAAQLRRAGSADAENASGFRLVSAALGAGELGIDAATAIVQGLAPAADHASAPDLYVAERSLVDAATATSALWDDVSGAGQSEIPKPLLAADAPTPALCTADEIRTQALVWRAILDPAGVERDERGAFAGRSLRVGRVRDGLVSISGRLLPEAAARLSKLLDAYVSPRTGPVFEPRGAEMTALSETAGASGGSGLGDSAVDGGAGTVGGVGAGAGATRCVAADAGAASSAQSPQVKAEADPRSIAQRRHDVLISILDAAARSDDAPLVGGAPPTVLVTVRQEDLESGCGVGFIDGSDTPVAIRAVRQMVCTGGIQTVSMDATGRLLSLGSSQRCFTPSQRRAITARDGGCIIPGCQVPASWCEIHHVIPASEGGPTHTDNGVLLCWYHHRSIDTSGWAIRMHHGSPQIQPPPWIDPNQHWHAATRSRTRLLRQLRHASAESRL